jgi:hypothetical protein
MPEDVRIVGIPEAIAGLGRIGANADKGLFRVGQKLADAVRAEIRPHHYTGRAEQQTHAELHGTGMKARVFVGVSTALVPEMRPLVAGWHSNSGKMPPVQAIAEWLAHKPELSGSSSHFRTSKGFVRSRKGATIGSISAEANVRSRAFVIARAIGRRGYSFGKTDAFDKAWAVIEPQIPRILEEFMRTGAG